MKHLNGRSDIGGWNKKPVVAITPNGHWFNFNDDKWLKLISNE